MLRILLFLCCSAVIAQTSYDEAAIIAYRDTINREFATQGKSPLEESDRLNFKGLDFYPPNAEYFVQAKFVATPKAKAFKMKTTTSRLPLYRKYGELHFTLQGKNLKLNVYQRVPEPGAPASNHLFLPFSDQTNGKETYIGGRYLDMEIPEGKSVAIDFNRAYNPYCAYSYRYSCPIVPLENDLPVEIRAGVKKFHY